MTATSLTEACYKLPEMYISQFSTASLLVTEKEALECLKLSKGSDCCQITYCLKGYYNIPLGIP